MSDGHPDTTPEIVLNRGLDEVENRRLKQLLAEAELDKAMLKYLAKEKW